MRYNALNLNKNRNNKRSNDLYKLSSFIKLKHIVIRMHQIILKMKVLKSVYIMKTECS